MVEKIEAGKRYRIDLSRLLYTRREDVEKYSDNGIILISKLNHYGTSGIWKFKKENGENNYWWFIKDDLLPLREEAFLEIFKEELCLSP